MMSEEAVSEVEVSHEELMGSTFLVDDGGEIRYAYLVQLDDSGTGELHSIELQSEEGDGGGISMAYYQTHQPTMDLDDEQASAAANLLEFNQQVYILPDQQLETEHDMTIESQPVPLSLPPPVIIHTPIMQNPKITKTYGGGKGKSIGANTVSTTQHSKPAPRPPVVPSVSTTSKSNNGPSNPVKVLPHTAFRRKRKLIVDTTKVIPNAEFRKQLKEPVVVSTAEFAPPTKKAMLQMSYSGVGKFFASPGRKISSTALSQLFLSHLTIRAEIPSIPVPDAGGMFEPLDPELRTPDHPITSELDGGFVSSFITHMARQKAESFDILVKGMGKARGSGPKSKKPSFLSTITRDRFISPKIEFMEHPPVPVMMFKEERIDPLLIHTETVETDYQTLSSSTNVQIQSEDGELIISDLQPVNGEFLYDADTCPEPTETETVFYMNGDAEQSDEGVEMGGDVKTYQQPLYLE